MSSEFAPDSAVVQAKFQDAFANHQKGQVDAARGLYAEVLAIAPGHFDALHFSGVLAAQGGAFAQAVDLIARAIAINPTNPAAHYNLGLALGGMQRQEEALAAYDKALVLDPQYVGAHLNRGLILLDQKRNDEAIAAFDRVIALKPDFHQAHILRGNAFRRLGKRDDALDAYAAALAVNANLPEVHNECGMLLAMLNQPDAAVASFAAATRLNPDYGEAHANFAAALFDLRRFDEALISADRAVLLRPQSAEALHTRAMILAAGARADDAIADYCRALALRPSLVEAHNNLGYLLLEQGKSADAVAAFEAALRCDASYPFLFGMRLHIRAALCRWEGFAEDVDLLGVKIARGESAIPPLPAMTLLDAPSLHRKAAEAWTQARHPENPALGAIAKRPFKSGDKIRIGYFSADFRDHPVALLMAGLIEQHDRARFQVYGFSHGVNTQDTLRKRLEKSFDVFFDVRARSDREIAALARAHGIDIAVDLTGHTGDGRTSVFAHRAAPVQVNYLGYPGTMGAPYMDYIVADKILIPADERDHYTEKVVWMPQSYQVNDASRVVAGAAPARHEVGLPDKGFVFACFNSAHKINPPTFESWMEILRQVEGSTLWLLEDKTETMEGLRRHAVAHGVDSSRLVFAPRVPIADHVARQTAADLFLDTSPYNAHTTCSDALWAGLPVLTQRGRSFPSRVASSLLQAIALPELIAEDRQDYIARAVALARDPACLKNIKDKLAHHRATTPLFDTIGFARRLEEAYEIMCARYHAGEVPDHIVIAP